AVDSFSRVADKTGTNDCANAPSANSRRMKLGILNATRNASICGPAPNSTANSTSRANPNTRDVRVKPPTTPLERAIEADLECFSVTLVDMQNKGIFKHRQNAMLAGAVSEAPATAGTPARSRLEVGKHGAGFGRAAQVATIMTWRLNRRTRSALSRLSPQLRHRGTASTTCPGPAALHAAPRAHTDIRAALNRPR